MFLYNNILKDVVIPKTGNDITYLTDLNSVGREFLGERFVGVFPADKIPKLTSEQPYAVVNLDNSNEPGSHWIAVAKHRQRVMVYDSFGRSTKEILPSLLKSGNGKVVDTEYDNEQNLEENNCGARSLAWLILFDLFGSRVAKKI